MTVTAGPSELVVPLGNDVFLIDTELGEQPRTTGCYLILGDEPALIETGPTRNLPRLLAALNVCGIGPQDLATIAVTHIHLDHAGAVGDLAQAFPKATVVVHPTGAPHVVNPDRLMDSALRVYGPTLHQLFGRMFPTPAERVIAAEDGHRVRVGPDRTLILHHSPGHARHHVVLLDEATGDLYTGDAAGMYVPDTKTYKPTTPPPEFDFDETMRSLALFRSMRPTRLMFTHYGPGPSVEDGLAAAEAEVRFWVDQTRAARVTGAQGKELTSIVRAATEHRYRRLTNSPFHQRWEDLSSTQANVDGILRWLDSTGR